MILICDAPSSTVCCLNARSQSLLPDRFTDPGYAANAGRSGAGPKKYNRTVGICDPRERRRLFGVALRRQDQSLGAAGQ